MKQIFSFIISSLFTFSLLANEHYVYRASVLMALNATLVIDVDKADFNNKTFLHIKSNSNVRAFGKEVVNLDYIGFNDVTTFEPKINIECEHSSKQTRNNCRSVKFLPLGQFLYKEYHNDKTELEDLIYGSENVVLKDIINQQPTYDPNRDKIYDLSSIALLIKYLDLNKDHRDLELFVAVNQSMAKVKVSYVQDLGENKMWIKLTPINPPPQDFKISFPYKIIYDKKLKAVTEIHQMLPYVGDVSISLDIKASKL